MFRYKKTTIYLIGDFNIILLNYDNHKGTRDFIDVLFSLGLFPLFCIANHYVDRKSKIFFIRVRQINVDS